MGLRVLFYRTEGGASPVERYLETLSGRDREEVFAAIMALGVTGLDGLDSRHLGGKLAELRFSSQRLLYTRIPGDAVVLLHAYKKQGQKAPPREIATAHRRMMEVIRWLDRRHG